MSDLPKNAAPDGLVDSKPTEGVAREDMSKGGVRDDDEAQLPLQQVAAAAARVLGARIEAAAVASQDPTPAVAGKGEE